MAKLNVIIIDAYVNEDVLNLVSTKDQAVEVNILRKSIPAVLMTAARAFNKQHQATTDLIIRAEGKLYSTDAQTVY